MLLAKIPKLSQIWQLSSVAYMIRCRNRNFLKFEAFGRKKDFFSKFDRKTALGLQEFYYFLKINCSTSMLFIKLCLLVLLLTQCIFWCFKRHLQAFQIPHSLGICQSGSFTTSSVTALKSGPSTSCVKQQNFISVDLLEYVWSSIFN